MSTLIGDFSVAANITEKYLFVHFSPKKFVLKAQAY